MPTRQGAFNEAAPQQATRHPPSLPGRARRLRERKAKSEEKRGIKRRGHSTMGLKGDPGGASCGRARNGDPQAEDSETRLNSEGGGRVGTRQCEEKLQTINGISPSMDAIQTMGRAR